MTTSRTTGLEKTIGYSGIWHVYLMYRFSKIKKFKTYLFFQMHRYRDWSLITGRGATKREGGHAKFYPYEKGGAEKVLAMLKGGHKMFWGSFYVVA